MGKEGGACLSVSVVPELRLWKGVEGGSVVLLPRKVLMRWTIFPEPPPPPSEDVVEMAL